MEKTKKDYHGIIAAAAAIILSVFPFLICAMRERSPSANIFFVALGLAAGLGIYFVEEEHLKRASFILYVGMIVLLIYQISPLCPSVSGIRRYIIIGSFSFVTTTLVPLTFPQTIKSLACHKSPGIKEVACTFALMLIPIALIYLQENLLWVFIFSVTAYATLLIAKKKKFINVSWLICLIPLVMGILFAIWCCSYFTYMQDRLEVIFTRGQCDPYGDGWTRIKLDEIFRNTPLIGKCSVDFGENDVLTVLAGLGCSAVVMILAQYGWLAFIGVILLYVLFFIALFKMTSKTKQSNFAHYLSVYIAVYFALRFALCLVSMFALHNAVDVMPFISTGSQKNGMDIFLFGVILSLYLQRKRNFSDEGFEASKLMIEELPAEEVPVEEVSAE